MTQAEVETELQYLREQVSELQQQQYTRIKFQRKLRNNSFSMAVIYAVAYTAVAWFAPSQNAIGFLLTIPVLILFMQPGMIESSKRENR